jgi:hypothetical protein
MVKIQSQRTVQKMLIHKLRKSNKNRLKSVWRCEATHVIYFKSLFKFFRSINFHLSNKTEANL